jgi:hypothetical protein
MPLIIVEDGESAEDVAARLAAIEPRISIDGTIVRALEELGVTPKRLKAAILTHAPTFAERKRPIDVGAGEDVELHGRLEGDVFRADRLITGPVTYFAVGFDGNPHLVDYTNVRPGSGNTQEEVVSLQGKSLREAIDHPCYRSRNPIVLKASRTFAKALHLSLSPNPSTI